MQAAAKREHRLPRREPFRGQAPQHKTPIETRSRRALNRQLSLYHKKLKQTVPSSHPTRTPPSWAGPVENQEPKMVPKKGQTGQAAVNEKMMESIQSKLKEVGVEPGKAKL